MPFEVGNIGRPKGAKGALTRRVESTAERLGVDPFEILCLFAKGDWEALGYQTETRIAFTSAGIEFEEPIISTDNRLSAAKEAAKYLYSQKRSIEHTQSDVTKDMTPEQKIEAMKQAIHMLELQTENKKHDAD